MQPRLLFIPWQLSINKQEKRPDKQTQSLSNCVADGQKVLKYLSVAPLLSWQKISGLFYEGQTDKCGNHFPFACPFRMARALTELVWKCYIPESLGSSFLCYFWEFSAQPNPCITTDDILFVSFTNLFLLIKYCYCKKNRNITDLVTRRIESKQNISIMDFFFFQLLFNFLFADDSSLIKLYLNVYSGAP